MTTTPSTAPAPDALLTDEEIMAAWDAHEKRAWNKTLISPPVFARAIEAAVLAKLRASAAQPQAGQPVAPITESEWSILDSAVENMRLADPTESQVDARWRLAYKVSEIAKKLNPALYAGSPPSAPAVPDELGRIKALLQDPAAVHAALIRGEIAKPDIRAMLHAYGSDALDRWDSGHEPKAAAPSVDALRAAMRGRIKVEGGEARYFSRDRLVIPIEDALLAIDQLAALAQTAQAAEPAELLRAAEALFACHCRDATAANWLDRTRATLASLQTTKGGEQA